MATKNEDERIPDEVMNEAVNQAQAAAGAQQQKPTYAGSFDQQLDDLYKQITERGPFTYDAKEDPLYQAYKDQYIQGGKLAMKDTMGQAAALTGGYGSTYGQQVGQQTYDAYLKDFGAVIPELYGMAYDQYKDKGDELLTQYGLLGDRRNAEYNRYRDAMSDWNYQQELQRQQEERDYNRQMAEQAAAESRQQQAYANLTALIRASGYNPTDAELQAAGLTREAAQALINEYIRSITPTVTATSGGGGGSSGGGGRSSGGSSGSGSAAVEESYGPGIDRRAVSALTTPAYNARSLDQLEKYYNELSRPSKYYDQNGNANETVWDRMNKQQRDAVEKAYQSAIDRLTGGK